MKQKKKRRKIKSLYSGIISFYHLHIIMTKKISPFAKLTKADFVSWAKNVALFFAPVVLYIVGQLQANLPIDLTVVKVTALGLFLNLVKKRLQ